MATFYQKHHRALRRLLTDFARQIEDEQGQGQLDLPGVRANFQEIAHSALSHPMRPYQMEALFLTAALLDARYYRGKGKNARPAVDGDLWKDLNEKVTIKRGPTEIKQDIPVLAYEMATGSGKTNLMGALMLYLFGMGIRNFFVVTPRLAVYRKSIQNFLRHTSESVWGKAVSVGFNVITGENFADPNMFHAENDINIYVFNLEKFSDQAKKTKVPIEGARHLRDSQRNLISLTEYLRSRELVVFSDEAHHTQKKFKEIIHDFAPLYLLEFTATANHSKQNVIYRYGIKELLEEKYCKTIMALGVDVGKKASGERILCEHEKIKLFSVMLVHLAKKYCLQFDPSTKNLKPLALIRVNSTIEQGRELHEYIRTKLCSEKDIVDATMKEIERQAHEITEAVHAVFQKKYGKDRKKLLADVQALINNSIFYTSDSKDRKHNEEVFSTIGSSRNPCELIVYITRLDEGINFPNIYTIGVVFDSKSNLRTAVKQVIGRGVRLNKPQREFDEDADPLLVQTEKLHIICDRGRNFEEEIKFIQKDFGVSSRVLGMEGKPADVQNGTLFDEQLEGQFFPRVRMSLKFKSNVSVFDEMEKYVELLNSYCEHNTFHDAENYPGKTLLRYTPKSLFTEIELFSDFREVARQIKQNGGVSTQFSLSPADRERITRNIIAGGQTQRLVPDVPRSFEILDEYFNRLEREVEYLAVDEADAALALISLRNTFTAFFRAHLEKHLCFPSDDELGPDGISLRQSLQPYKIERDESPAARKAVKNRDDEDISKAVREGYYFAHFTRSHFQFVRFDSFPEYQMAEVLDNLAGGNQRGWWVRNERQLYMEYGFHRYYPDFLLCLGGKYYVIEAKGEVFSSTFKNRLLAAVKRANPDYEGLLLFEKDIAALAGRRTVALSDMISLGAANLAGPAAGEREQPAAKRRDLPKLDLDRRKYVDLVPVYSIAAACGRFGREEFAEIEGWVEVPRKGNLENFFVVRASGDSMVPQITDGDYCLFTKVPAGSNLGKTVLVQHRAIPSADYGGHYTIKMYDRTKVENEGGEAETVAVTLRPLNNRYAPIEIAAAEVSDDELILAGVLVENLGRNVEIMNEPH